MADYQITIKNRSGQSRAYILFAEVPQVDNADASEVYTNVYLAAPPVPNGTGTANFQIHKDLYAITGTNPTPLGSKVSVNTSDSEPVVLGSTNSKGTNAFMTMVNGGAQFDTTKLSTTTTAGAYGIRADNSFEYPNHNHPFLGLGAADPSDPTNIVPVATFPAQPGVQYFIYPVTKYYIAWGTYVPGEIIDVKSLGDVQEIDFTGKPYKAAKIVHNDDGTYTVTYQ